MSGPKVSVRDVPSLLAPVALLKTRKKTLESICKRLKVDSKGTKRELFDRILASERAQSICAAEDLKLSGDSLVDSLAHLRRWARGLVEEPAPELVEAVDEADAAPDAADLVSGWLGEIKNLAQHLEITDHLA